MKRLDLCPFHLFEHRGMRFAYNVANPCFLRLDDASYAWLAAFGRSSSAEAATAEVAERFGAETAAHVEREVALLRSRGVLAGPVMTHDGGDYRRKTAELVRLGTPRVELYLAEACNLRCRYCYVREHDALDNGLMRSEVARGAVDLVFRRADASDFVQITFFGGEPLLNKPVLLEVIEYSQWLGRRAGKRVQYSMTTNGTLLDDQVIDLIKRYDFGLMVSMDGPPEVHDDHRPLPDGGGSFKAAARGIKALMRRRRRVTVRCTLSNRHLDVVGIVNFLERFGFTRIALCHCNGKSYGVGDYDLGPEHMAVMEEQWDLLLERALQQVKDDAPRPYDPLTSVVSSYGNGQLKAPALRCGICRGCTTVGIDGALYPCHRYVGMENWVIGDVWHGVDDRRHAECLAAYFATKEKCESCWAVHWCGGQCPWYVSHEDGTCRPPQEWYCQRIRQSIERGAGVYERLRAECPEFVEETLSRLAGDGASTSAERARGVATGVPATVTASQLPQEERES